MKTVPSRNKPNKMPKKSIQAAHQNRSTQIIDSFSIRAHSRSSAANPFSSTCEACACSHFPLGPLGRSRRTLQGDDLAFLEAAGHDDVIVVAFAHFHVDR